MITFVAPKLLVPKCNLGTRKNDQIKHLREALNLVKHDPAAYASLQKRIGEWYDAGEIAHAKGGAINSYDGLKKIANLGNAPDGMIRPRRHHDFPIGDGIDRELIIRGLDPNEYGRWLPRDVHQKMHKGEGYPKPFNQYVKDFFEEAENTGVVVTDTELLQLLNEIRNDYPYP